MPLLDHFQPPLSVKRAWESFYGRWVNSLADELHRLLPPQYFAEVRVQQEGSVEVDITGEEWRNWELESVRPTGATSDEFGVSVYDQLDEPQLVAVVELVSPRNKDRDDSRRAFATKCAAYLQCGIGVIVADIVTVRPFNLHNELIDVLRLEGTFTMPADAGLYAVAYRPARRGEDNQIDVWPHPLQVGGVLPTLPLALRGTRAIPLDLELAYEDARRRSNF